MSKIYQLISLVHLGGAEIIADVLGRAKYENHFTLPLFEQRLRNILQEVI